MDEEVISEPRKTSPWFFVILLSLVGIFFFGIKFYKPLSLQYIKEKCIRTEPNNHKRVKCLTPYFERLTREYSALKASEEIISLRKSGDIYQCHIPSHVVGNTNFEKYNFDSGQAFATCPQSCQQGCHHGVMEALVEREGDLEKVLTGIENLCLSVATSDLLVQQCSHGVGHGIMRHTGITLTQAMEHCGRFPEGLLQNACRGGALMEHTNTFLPLDRGAFVEAIPTMCKELVTHKNGEYMPYCVRRVAEAILFYEGDDIQKAQELCLKLQPEYHEICRRHVPITSDVFKRDLEGF